MSDDVVEESVAIHFTFFLGEEEYGIPLSRVFEIVPFGEITRVPAASPNLRGLVDVAGTVVPVVDLGRRFGIEPQEASLQRQSIVTLQVSLQGRPVLLGLLVDRLGRVLRVDPRDIVPKPPLEALIAVEFITGVIQSSGRHVLCLDLDRILGAEEGAEVLEHARSASSAEVEAAVARVPFLIVRVAAERCALDLARLREVQSLGHIARIPGAEHFVLGAVNVRGSIIPVVDVGQRFGLEASGRGPGSCLVLIEVGDDRYADPVGLLVEAVEGLVKLEPSEIDRTPPFGTRFPAELVTGMAPVSGRFAPILDTDRALAADALAFEAAAYLA